MTSIRGADPYHYIIQAHPCKKTHFNQVTFRPGSVYGFLKQNDKFKILTYLIEMAKLEKQFDNIQFNGTLFVIKDSDIDMTEKQIMNMSRGDCMSLLRHLWINRKISLNTILSRKNGILDTYDPSYQLTLKRVNQTSFINDDSQILGELPLDNGMLIFLNKMIKHPFSLYTNNF